jgi:acetyl-CoA C-acetyltransferase
MATEAYIFDAVRTPRGRGKKDGSLHSVKPISLLTTVLHALQERNSLDTAQVDDIVMGCVTAVGDQGADIAKTAALAADWDETVAGVTLNRFCASGLEAVNLAAMKVRSGWEDLVVAGGVEAMSRVPMGSDGGAWATDPETNLHTGFMPQGIGADLIATIDGFSREDVDNFAVKSQQKAANAWENGYFSRSIVPVTDQNGVVILDRDEHVRADTTVESLSSLKPSFQMMGEMGFDGVAREKYHYVEKINHIHHAGNSSGIVDGATAMLIGSEAKGKALGLKPRARIIATAVTSTDPTIMLTGPAPATRKVLKTAGLELADMDVIELNEAFAAQALAVTRDLGLPDDAEHVNPNGGAIALGHPLGMSGARLITTALNELERRHQAGQKARYALCTMCIGVGQGIALIIERTDSAA